MNKQDTRYEKLQILLKELRKSQGMTQQDLADSLGKPQSYVSKLESGERNVDLIELMDMVESMGLDIQGVLDHILMTIGS